MQGTKVQLFIKRPALPEQLANTVLAEANNVIEAYMTTMENARLQEIAMQPDAPFLGAGMGTGDVIGIIPTLDATVFVARTASWPAASRPSIPKWRRCAATDSRRASSNAPRRT